MPLDVYGRRLRLQGIIPRPPHSFLLQFFKRISRSSNLLPKDWQPGGPCAEAILITSISNARIRKITFFYRVERATHSDIISLPHASVDFFYLNCARTSHCRRSSVISTSGSRRPLYQHLFLHMQIFSSGSMQTIKPEQLMVTTTRRLLVSSS